MGDYNYKLDVFEGPLDLLLHLIEKHKIEITDIPIVEITSQYLAYLDNWNHFDIHYSSEFLVMASTLLQIKSRMLLPKAEPEPDEAEDPRDELVAKLVEFKKIKDITSLLMERTAVSANIFSRPEETSVLGLDSVYNLELSQLYQIRIHRGECLYFRELLVAIETKSGMVTIFMAVLELLKQQVMEMRYEDDDIIFTAILERAV
ncbi:MAG: segregation/condensation protein A [Veillonella sp.]|nr:segregation/condensation protein A [Veillonella sp.]